MEDERKLISVVHSVLDTCNEVEEFWALSVYVKFSVLFAASEFYRKCAVQS